MSTASGGIGLQRPRMSVCCLGRTSQAIIYSSMATLALSHPNWKHTSIVTPYLLIATLIIRGTVTNTLKLYRIWQTVNVCLRSFWINIEVGKVCPSLLLLDIFKHSNENQVSISSLVIFRRIPHPMDSCGGCPVGTWGVSQVNLMKKSAVIGSWIPKLTKARLNEGSEVKIALPFASGLPCLAHWILQVTKFIFAITNWLQLV